MGVIIIRGVTVITVSLRDCKCLSRSPTGWLTHSLYSPPLILSLWTSNFSFLSHFTVLFLFLQANQCNDPQEIYNYLFNQKIGTELAAFYESWSWQFECAGNMKRADNIFKEGIQRGAHPLDLLLKKHQSVKHS